MLGSDSALSINYRTRKAQKTARKLNGTESLNRVAARGVTGVLCMLLYRDVTCRIRQPCAVRIQVLQLLFGGIPGRMRYGQSWQVGRPGSEWPKCLGHLREEIWRGLQDRTARGGLRCHAKLEFLR